MTRPAPTLAPVPPPAPPGPELEPPEGALDLAEHLHVILDARWLVLAAVAAALALGGAWAWLATPIYRSDVLIQVEDKKAGMGALGDIAGVLGDSASPAETEIEIIRSRSVVGAVVDSLHLDVVAEPPRLPLLGRALARRHRGRGGRRRAARPRRIRLGRRDPAGRPARRAAALLGEPLTLRAGEAGRFDLLAPGGSALVAGAVGAAGRPAGGVTLLVSALAAPGPAPASASCAAPREVAIQDLQDDLRVGEKGKKTGILSVSLEGPDRDRLAATLDAVAAAYLRQNVERKSRRGRQDAPVPRDRSSRWSAPAWRPPRPSWSATSSARAASTSAWPPQAMVARSVEVEKAASELQLEDAALRPALHRDPPGGAGASRTSCAGSTPSAPPSRPGSRRCPSPSWTAPAGCATSRWRTSSTSRSSTGPQELKVVKEGTLGNVRILDAALRPDRARLAAARRGSSGWRCCSACSAASAWPWRAAPSTRASRIPTSWSGSSGIPVFASVPFSKVEADRVPPRPPGPSRCWRSAAPRDLAVESLRNLRTALQFSLFESGSKVVSVSGPAPGVGKSFVIANLGHLLAEAGKRVVLVDADIRRGTLHRLFGLDRGLGLADVIAGTPLDEALHETAQPGLTLVTSGTLPPNPAELLSSDRLGQLVAELAERFDLVLLDTPPVLAVTDAALVARHAGVNLLVARSGQHRLRELTAALRSLGRNGIRVNGFVLNGVRLDRGLGRRSAYHYQYKYQ